MNVRALLLGWFALNKIKKMKDIKRHFIVIFDTDKPRMLDNYIIIKISHKI